MRQSKTITDKHISIISADAVQPTSRMLKQITINSIDTGSQITVMHEDIYNRIKSSQLDENIIYLTGFGKNEVFSLGYVETVSEVDYEQYSCMIHVVQIRVS